MMKIKQAIKRAAAPQKGFTLIELVIVLGIISVMMLILIPNLNRQREVAMKRSDAALSRVVKNQAKAYAAEKNRPVSSVTLDELKKAHYLDEDQVQRAESKAYLPVNDDDASQK